MTEVTIVTNPTIGATVKQAVNQSLLDVGTGTRDNPVKGWASSLGIKVIITPRHTDTDAFVMLNSSANACPLVFVENMSEQMVTSKAGGSDYEHDADAWQYGVKAVGTAALGRFTDAILMTFT